MTHSIDTSLRLPLTANTVSNANPLTAAYTCGAGATVLALMLFYDGAAVDRSGGPPTYNGVALTQAGTTRRSGSSPEGSAEMWFLLDPPTGSALTISIPNAGIFNMEAVAVSAKAPAGYHSALDATGGSGNTNANPAAVLTAIGFPTIIFAGIFTGATTWAPSARAGTQLYDDDNGAWGAGAQYFLHATAGNKTMNWTFGTSDDYGLVIGAFVERVSGAAARTLGAITPSAAGTVKVAGAAAKTLGAITSAGSGVIKVQGAAARTLGPTILAAAAAVHVAGQGAATLGAIAAAAAGIVRAQGAADQALGDVASAGGGIVRVRGAAAVQLSPMATDITGEARIQGAAARALAAVTLDAAGTSAQIIQGAAALQLGALAITAAVRVRVVGQGAVTLAGVLAAGAGDVRVKGLAGIALNPIQILAAARGHELAPAGRTIAVGAFDRRASVGRASRIIDVGPADRVSHA